MELAHYPAVQKIIDLALTEDLDRGDVTTRVTVGAGTGGPLSALVVARAPLVLCGASVAAEVFRKVDPTLDVEALVMDGTSLPADSEVIRVRGASSSILMAERTALNFLQRLCGVASFTRRFVEAVAGTGARIVDTRKTTPGFRALEKAAVVVGGGLNHRADLGSGILIKDNHIAACGSVTKAVTSARAHAPHGLKVEVEVETEGQLDEAMAANTDIVLLDNMTVGQVTACAEKAHARGILVEVSGGLTLDTVRAYAEAGADILSIGALTHSAPAADLSLDA